ncbi:hypothetical protein AC792_06840 [Arthrobacter sp. RIT-PI-e]|nr:hypothetical protein AC792_06840 [Arthrobacter sp. RIT-PI-e]
MSSSSRSISGAPTASWATERRARPRQSSIRAVTRTVITCPPSSTTSVRSSSWIRANQANGTPQVAERVWSFATESAKVSGSSLAWCASRAISGTRTSINGPRRLWSRDSAARVARTASWLGQ